MVSADLSAAKHFRRDLPKKKNPNVLKHVPNDPLINKKHI